MIRHKQLNRERKMKNNNLENAVKRYNRNVKAAKARQKVEAAIKRYNANASTKSTTDTNKAWAAAAHDARRFF